MAVSCVTFSLVLLGILQHISYGKAHVLFSTPRYITNLYAVLTLPFLHCEPVEQKNKNKEITHIIRTYLYSCYTKPEPKFSNVIIINITYIYHCNAESHKNVSFYPLPCQTVTCSSMLELRQRSSVITSCNTFTRRVLATTDYIVWQPSFMICDWHSSSCPSSLLRLLEILYWIFEARVTGIDHLVLASHGNCQGFSRQFSLYVVVQ